jgi:ubiquinone biosynthesis protein
MVENIGRQLDPNFNLAEYCRPYIQQLLIHRLRPSSQLRELRFTLVDLFHLLKDLPYEIRTILRQVREGQVKMQIEFTGLESIRRTLNQIFNRVVVAIIVAALLVSSSIIVYSGLPPLVSGMPIIGLTGFIIAALLGIWLVISVLRNGIT